MQKRGKPSATQHPQPSMGDDAALSAAIQPIVNSGANVQKMEFESPNKEQFSGFLFEPGSFDGIPPCVVIYCPSESSVGDDGEEALDIVKHVLPLRIAILCLGMAGGYSAPYERGVLSDVVQHLRKLRMRYQRIALWGRSGGAVAALRCVEHDPSLAAVICDGAYSHWLKSLELPEWIETPLMNLRNLVGRDSAAMAALGRAQKQDSPLDVVSRCFVPALFIHGADDEVVPKSHACALRSAYAGEAQALSIPGGTHDSLRPPFIFARALLFLLRALRREVDDYIVEELERVACDQATAPDAKQPPLPATPCRARPRTQNFSDGRR